MSQGKVKCSLFSEDGKLLSPTDNGAVKKVDADKELAGLKSTSELKKSLFSEGGKLNDKKDVKPVESAKNENKPEPKAEVTEKKVDEKELKIEDVKGPKKSTKPSVPQDMNDSDNGMSHGLDYLDDLLNDDNIEDEEEELLKWSSDEPHHLSDYNIEVTNSTTGSKTTYYVHKLVLSTGPTKCELFGKLFSGGAKAPNGKSISISHSAADAFPALLDFLYSREDSLDLHSDNAVALRHLGKLFVIKKLVMMVTRFIRTDLIAQKSLHYLNSSFEFMDLSLIDTAAKVCADSITFVNREGLTSLDPFLFSKVVVCDNVACSSEELSKIVSEFCRKHADVLNSELLRVVTGVKNMPTIDRTECVYLLQLSEQYQTDDDGECNLKGRCILSGSDAWNNTIVKQLKVEPDAAGPYDLLTSDLKVDLLQDALIQAKKDFEDTQTRKNEALQQIQAEAMQKMSSKDKSVKDMDTKVTELEAECARLKKELSRFKRMTADYKFPKNRVQYSYHPQGEKYGKEKPTALPDTGAKDENAGIIVMQNGKVWPVYYYCK